VSWKLSAVVGLGLVLGILAGRVFQDDQTGTASWDGLRAAGFAAYLLLWVGLVTGMAVHMRYRPGPLAMTWLLETHRIASALSLSFVAGHIAGLLVDPTIAFSPLDIATGLSSSYRPVQVALGSLATWLSIVVLGSTALAGRMPYASWRNLHYLSFPAYFLALLHGVTSGTDASAPISLVVYASTASFVAAMVVARLFGRGWVTAGGTAGPPI
jgi:predicted ferric reductase